MKIVDSFFVGYKAKDDTLPSIGFIKNKEGEFVKAIEIKKGQFRLELVFSKGTMKGKLIDTDFDEEYAAIEVEGAAGSFIGEIKEECEKELTKIRDACFEKVDFLFPQSNRIAKYIKARYEVDPDFPWPKYENYGVFRNKDNEKWFGIIMNIKGSKLGLDDNLIEIMDINLPNEEIIGLLGKKGYHPAYHMNKKSWITIILNDSLGDEEIEKAIDDAFAFVKEK